MLPEDKPTHWYIFEPLWQCQVPQLATRSEIELRLFGMPTTGIAEVDRTLDNQWIDTFITIEQMVNYFKNGASIKILKHEDSMEIYKRIQNHLDAWAGEVKKGWALNRIPKEDLVDLDRFATAIYPHARNHFRDPVPESSFARALASMSNPFIPPPPKPENEDPEVVERKGMTEIFTSIPALEGGFRWK